MRIRTGIYCILNRITHQAYVGKASSISDRLCGHFWSLKKGNHPNKLLQASYDQHGRSSFAVNILETCAVDELDKKEHDWMLRVRPEFNTCVPDYAAVARGTSPDGRLRKRRNRVNKEPNRFICSCGKLKSLTSRSCLACLKDLSAKMVAAGYLPEGHKFEWQPEPYVSPIDSLRGEKGIRPRSEFWPDDEPNRPSPEWPQIKAAWDAHCRGTVVLGVMSPTLD